MAEPTLSLGYQDLLAEVGSFLGWGRGAAFGETAWTSTQQAQLESVVRSGLRQFYYPPPVGGMAGEGPYDWSFLTPLATLTLPDAQATLTLPDDFGGVEGRVTVSTPGGSGTSWWPLDAVGLGTVIQNQATMPTTTGRPCVCCVEPTKGTAGLQGQRFQLRVWPTPDQEYTLQLQYRVNPDALTAALPYVYGGGQHSETVLQSCLAVAEQRLDDARGVHQARWEERLLASIGLDRKLKPQKLGYNGDRSDLRDRRWGRAAGRLWGENGVTFNGRVL